MVLALLAQVVDVLPAERERLHQVPPLADPLHLRLGFGGILPHGRGKVVPLDVPVPEGRFRSPHPTDRTAELLEDEQRLRGRNPAKLAHGGFDRVAADLL